jgi:Fe2+ or Zn2+ uptake regulation protein
MQEKILAYFTANPERTTKEMIYVKILKKYPESKITTFIKELYNLMQEGVITRDENGLYGVGAYRAKQLDWLPVARETVEKRE